MNHSHPARRHRRTRPLLSGAVLGVIGLAATALVGVTGPAGAQSEPPATLQFVNAFDSDTDRFTAVVDDPTPSTRQEISVQELRTISPIDLAPGDHPVDIYPESDLSGAPIDSRTVTAASGESIAFAIHPSDTGTVATTIFKDDLSKTGSSTTRLQVRHVANADPVEIEISPADPSASGTNESFTIANGEQGVISAVDTTVEYELTVTPVGSTDPLITDTQVQLSPGRILTIYVAGNPPTGEVSSGPDSLLEATRDVGALPPPKVNLVNGFTSESFVFYVDDTQNASIEGLRRNGQLQGLGEGEVTVDAYRASGTPGQGTPSVSLDITVCDGRSYDLAVYQDATNATQLTLFENDVTAPATDKTRFTIRHIGARNSLDFVFDGSGENAPPDTRAEFSLSNGQERVIDDAFINDYLVNAYEPGTTSNPVAQNPDLEGEGNATQIAYVMGTPPGSAPSLSAAFPGAGEPVIPDAPAPAGPNNDCGSTSTSTTGGNTSTSDGTDTGGSTGGTDTGGSSTGGSSTGGTDTGGSSSGGTDTGGSSTGGTDTGGSSSGGTDTGGSTGGSGGSDTGGSTGPLPNGGSNPDTTAPQPADGDFFSAVTPARALDTRSGASGPVAAGGTLEVPVAGEYGVPSDATAVAVNVGVARTAGTGFVSATPEAPSGAPSTSVLTFGSANSTASANATVPLNADGSFTLYASTETDLIVDVVGYYSPTDLQVTSGRFVPLTPDRLFDTRNDEAPSGKVVGGSTISVPALGRAGLPSNGVQSVVLNLTAAQQTDRGFVAAADAQPDGLTVSSLNYRPGDGPVANLVIVDLNGGDDISLYAQTDVHLIGDVLGYFTDDDASLSTAGLLQLLDAPTRVFDTRGSGVKISPSSPATPDVVAELSVAARDVLALSMSVTAVQAEGQTFVTVSPNGNTDTSTLNLPSDERRSNAAYTGVADDGTIVVSASNPVHVLGDVFGYFQTAD